MMPTYYSERMSKKKRNRRIDTIIRDYISPWNQMISTIIPDGVSSLQHLLSIASVRTSGDGNEVLVTAIRKHQYEKIKNLFENDLLDHNNQININGSDDIDGPTPLCIACAVATNDAKIVALLLEYGANPNYGEEIIEMNEQYYHSMSYSPLLCATRQSVTKDVMMHLLLCHANPNAINRSSRGWSPLHFVCHYANYEKIELLLQHGANVNQHDIHGDTPVVTLLHEEFIHHRLDDNHVSCLRLLLEHGADPNVSLLQVFRYVRDKCRLDAIRLLIRYGADITIPMPGSHTGDTILHATIRLRDFTTVRAMTEHHEEKTTTCSIWWLRNHDDKTLYEVATQLDAVPNIECFEMKLRKERYDYLWRDWIHL